MKTIKDQLTIISNLKTAKDKISDPARWIKGDFAKWPDGRPAMHGEKDPTICFCSFGAVLSVVSEFDARRDVVDYLDLVSKAYAGSNIVAFNDSPNTTHKSLMAVWDKAIKLAEDELVVMNLEHLLKAVEAHPEDMFDLTYYNLRSPCGTLFCTVGLATTLPEFQAQGYDFASGYTKDSYIVKVNGEDVTGTEVTDAAFGQNSFESVFSLRFGSKYDKEFVTGRGMPDRSALSDKTLAIHRLKEQIKLYKEKVNVA